MWSKIKAGFRWLGTPWRAVKSKWCDEWTHYSIIDFKNFTDNVGGALCGVALLSVAVSCIIALISLVAPIPVILTWLQYYLLTIMLPSMVMLMGCIALTKHISWWRNNHNSHAVYWNEHRVKKYKHFFKRAMVWSWVFYVTGIVLLSMSAWGPFVFTASFWPNMFAVRLLFYDIVWFPTCLFMIFSSWMHLCFTRYTLHLSRMELDRLYARQDRNTGSMPDNVDEDDIWEYKLERLGL